MSSAEHVPSQDTSRIIEKRPGIVWSKDKFAFALLLKILEEHHTIEGAHEVLNGLEYISYHKTRITRNVLSGYFSRVLGTSKDSAELREWLRTKIEKIKGDPLSPKELSDINYIVLHMDEFSIPDDTGEKKALTREEREDRDKTQAQTIAEAFPALLSGGPFPPVVLKEIFGPTYGPFVRVVKYNRMLRKADGTPLTKDGTPILAPSLKLFLSVEGSIPLKTAPFASLMEAALEKLEATYEILGECPEPVPENLTKLELEIGKVRFDKYARMHTQNNDTAIELFLVPRTT